MWVYENLEMCIGSVASLVAATPALADDFRKGLTKCGVPQRCEHMAMHIQRGNGTGPEKTVLKLVEIARGA